MQDFLTFGLKLYYELIKANNKKGEGSMSNKILNIALAGMFALSLASCGGRVQQPPKPTDPPAVQEPQPPVMPELPPQTPPPVIMPPAPSEPSVAPSSTPTKPPAPAPTTAPPVPPKPDPTVAPPAPVTAADKFFAEMAKIGIKQNSTQITVAIIDTIDIMATTWIGKDPEESKMLLGKAFDANRPFFLTPPANADEYLQRAIKFINTKAQDDMFYIDLSYSFKTGNVEVAKFAKKTKEFGAAGVDTRIRFYVEDNKGTFLNPKKYLAIPPEVYASQAAEVKASSFGIFKRSQFYSYSTSRTASPSLKWF